MRGNTSFTALIVLTRFSWNKIFFLFRQLYSDSWPYAILVFALSSGSLNQSAAHSPPLSTPQNEFHLPCQSSSPRSLTQNSSPSSPYQTISLALILESIPNCSSLLTNILKKMIYGCGTLLSVALATSGQKYLFHPHIHTFRKVSTWCFRRG